MSMTIARRWNSGRTPVMSGKTDADRSDLELQREYDQLVPIHDAVVERINQLAKVIEARTHLDCISNGSTPAILKEFKGL